MKTTIRTYLCLGLLAAPGFAQEQKPTSPAFEKALAVEELEHDLKGAIKLYEELVHAKNTAKEIKQRTFLRLGLAYRQLGQEDQAQAALRKAAEGAGELAMLAKKAMQKPDGVSRDRVELRKQADEAVARLTANVRAIDQKDKLIPSLGFWSGYWSSPGDDLVWLGAAAVPSLKREFVDWLNEPCDSPIQLNDHVLIPSSHAYAWAAGYRAYLAGILWENGTPEAHKCLEELLTGSSVARSQAISLGLLECGKLNDRTLAFFQRYLASSKVPIESRVLAAKVASQQGRSGSASVLNQLSAPQFMAIVKSAPRSVALELWKQLEKTKFRRTGLEIPGLGLAELIREMLESSHPGLNQVGYKVLECYGLQSVSLRLLTLQFVDRLPDRFMLKGAWGDQTIGGPDLDIRGGLIQGVEGIDNLEATSVKARKEIDTFVDVIAKVGPAPSRKEGRTPQTQLIQQFVLFYEGHGDFRALPVIVKSGEHGYLSPRSAGQWLARKGMSAHLPMVTKAMETSPIFDNGLGWLKKQTLNKENTPGIVAALGRLHAMGVQDRLRDVDREQYSGAAWELWFDGLDCLVKIDDPSALAYLLNLADNGEFAVAGERLLEMSRSGVMGELRSELRIALSTQVPGETTRHDIRTRSQILARLIELGDVETMIDTAGWSGFKFYDPSAADIRGVSGPKRQTSQEGQFAFNWLVAELTEDRKNIKPFHGYNAKQLAMIWSHHFEHPDLFPGLNPYAYLQDALRIRSSRSERFEGVVVPAIEAWIRRLKAGDFPKSGESGGLRELQERCLGIDRKSEPMNPAGMELISLSLGSGNAGVAQGAVGALSMPGPGRWEKEVRSWLTNKEVGAAVLFYLREKGLTLSNDEFQAVVATDHAFMFVPLLEALRQLVPNVPVELITPLLSNPDNGIRSKTCDVLAQRLDAKAVPALLKVLGDSSEEVRKAAKDALQQIRFFHDEKARWQRFFQGQEVSKVGAAQMLLAQASEDQPLATRLLAIRSLGTLAAPETLPFLIQWAAQGPPEVVSAAKSAIERINSAGGSTVDVK